LRSEAGLSRKLVGSYPDCDAEAAMEALDAAVAAYDNGQGAWPAMCVAERINCLESFLEKMIVQRELIIKLIVWEIGKTLKDSAKEFDRTVDYIKATIQELKNLDHRAARFDIQDGVISQTRRTPLGVVLCMGPFNYPLNETFTTLIPAVMMGNTLLFKSPKHGTLLHYPLLRAFQEAFPKGVINSVYGEGSKVIPPVMRSGKIDVFGFIGSSKVGNLLKKQHPIPGRLTAVMSLDAKCLAIVGESADLDIAAQECLAGALTFNGQRCTAIKIIYVHNAVAHAFLNKLSDLLAEMGYGMPWEKNVMITPVAEPSKPQYLRDCIADAEIKGAKVINPEGGKCLESFFYPAIVFPVNEQMKLFREEQFGPVIPVVPFQDVKEAINYQHESSHGLQVSIFSNDPKETGSLIDRFVNLVSRVNINSLSQRGPDTLPFTGRKDSAEGTLSISEGLYAFSLQSLVTTKNTASNKELIKAIVDEHQSDFLSMNYIM
jgi:acyl-CoA reductase-like NAD-dependent aldehyde dehydrogenase